jgi:uncharacterized RDD family membrane protein YckC
LSSPQQSVQVDNFETTPTWKDEVNQRLAAHRTRKVRRSDGQPTLPGLEPVADSEDSLPSQVAARVAERYAKAPTYREMLAQEAQNAARAANTAACAAQEAHQAAQAILAGLDMQPDSSEVAAVPEVIAPAATPRAESRPALRVEVQAEPRIKAHVESPRPAAPVVTAPPAPPARRTKEPAITEIIDPFEDAFVTPAQLLPANLIEFPRELVAARKARPRREESPLLDGDHNDPEAAQIRIFEVEEQDISHQPVVNSGVPEWSSIRLDASPRQLDEGDENHGGRGGLHPHRHSSLDLPLQTAPIEDRLMAAVVDVALVGVAFLLFVLVFVACTAHPPTGKSAFAGAGLALAGLGILYQILFFGFSDATPGMRYAKIALCTFDDENPSRKNTRGRVATLLLSALPLGLGFAWALFDEDHLGWHDRMSRTYQRSYR